MLKNNICTPLSSQRRIGKNLEHKYSVEILYNFRNKYEEYKDIMKKSSSIWNINGYSEFLNIVDKYTYKLKNNFSS